MASPRSVFALIMAAAAIGRTTDAITLLRVKGLQPMSGLSAKEAEIVDLARFPENAYYWPSPRGRTGFYSQSFFEGPSDLTNSLAWSWHHPAGRFHTVMFGQVMDGAQNTYLTCSEGIRKFSPDGKILWEYAKGQPRYHLSGEITASASLWNGMIYSSTVNCDMFALDMETGDLVWKVKIASTCAHDSGFTMVHDDLIIQASDVKRDEQKTRVQARNATTGAFLWDMKPEAPVWSFVPFFAGDGTFVFQDMEGRAYRHRTSDGSLIWKAGGKPGTWTDGQSLLGSNGIVYAVTRFKPYNHMSKNDPGQLSAYRLEDGKLLWNQEVPRSPNQSPALGQLPGKSGLSIVQPVGSQVIQGAEYDVYAFDAATGEQQWIFYGPAQKGLLPRADFEGSITRTFAGVRPVTLPHPWGNPTIDAKGTVYIGNEEGFLYALEDKDNDGLVKGESEVSTFDTKACFHGDSAPIVTPGMLVTSSTDTLFAFKNL
mmetsp:Transcript_128423/g.287131  ORF Transcript_128423/g.287131 Transcript_128423/m.287131 type:complete len:484 (+) Transcript_128423:55-1506(+)